MILSELNTIDTIFDKRMAENSDFQYLPILMDATLNERVTAKSHRSSTRAIFDEKEERNIIGFSKLNHLLVKINDKAAARRIRGHLYGFNSSLMSRDKRCGIAAIVRLKKYQPICNNNELIGHTLKVRLADYLNSDLNQKSKQIFESHCVERGYHLKALNYSKDMIMYRLENATEEILNDLVTCDGILSIKPMPYVEIMASPEPYNTKLDVMAPADGVSYAKAGLLDSGVEKIPHLEPWLEDGENQNTAGFLPRDIDHVHGTAVAGVMLYGDKLEGQYYTKCKPVKLTSCIVNTNPDLARVEEGELIEYIRQAVKDNPDVKVWNLSQGSNIEVKDDAFSDFGMALDSIQEEYNVLFCKSAGNQSHPENGHLRITNGADTVLGLVVGAISHIKKDSEDGEVNQRSPYSRIGFGPEYLIKPDLVHYGGNMVTGIQTFSITGYQTSCFKGTSFSTPRVTSLAANLAHQINGEFNPTLIKALLIHSACYPETNNSETESLLRELGHGVPANIEDIFHNDSDEFTMIFCPKINKGDDYQILDFPYPKSLIDNEGYYYGDIILTIVEKPILKSSEGSEYCQSDVDVKLETYRENEYYILGAAGTPTTYRNANRLGKPVTNVLSKELYSRKSFTTEDMKERNLIRSGMKYQPIKKYHVDLSKMTSSRKEKALKGDRHWALKIITLYRDSVDADLAIDGNIDEVDVALIITIRDPKHHHTVYDECIKQLDERNFEHNNIMINQQINIE